MSVSEPEPKIKAVLAVEHVLDAFGSDNEQMDKLVELLNGADLVQFGNMLKAETARRREEFYEKYPGKRPW